MRIFVTGAAGFIGQAVCREAVRRGHEVQALIHRTPLELSGIEQVTGNLETAAALVPAIKGCQAVIHAAAVTSAAHPGWEYSRQVNVEGTRHLVQAAGNVGVQQFAYISSMSAFPENPTPYGRTKYEGEEVVRASEIPYTILRPSIVYGPGEVGIFAELAEQVKKLPVLPIIGSGRTPQRPVHVDDVAWACLECLEHEHCCGQLYMLGGANPVTYKQFMQAVACAQGKAGTCVHLPVPVALVLARMMGLVLRDPPLTVDNVRGLTMAREVDNSAAERDFGYQPRTMETGLKEVFPFHS